MPAIYELVKGRTTHVACEEERVSDVVRGMAQHDIGAVAVLRGGELVGMFSEREVVKRVMAERRNPEQTRVADVMTTRLTVVQANESLENCLLLMKERGLRHLPICQGSRLIGIVSLRDLLNYGATSSTRSYLRAAS